MLGLGAYGSDSDNSDTEVASSPSKKPNITTTKLSEIPKLSFPKIDDDDESEPRLNLPTASTYSFTSINNDNDANEGESTTQIQRRDWEIKLVEKEKKKLQKNKKKIAAFGGLSSKVFEKEADDDDVIQKPTNRPIFANQSKSALLSSLPPPKTVQKSKPQTSALSFMPSTIKIKPVSKPTASAASSHIVKAKKPDYDEEEEGYSNNFNDFLGLSSVQKKDLLDIRSIPRPEINISNMFLVDEPIGPARPVPMDVEESTSSSSQQPPTKLKRIDDDAAKKLVYKHEVEHWGASNIFANDAVSGMIDVSVDKQLGPNVHQTLLKNMDHRTLASYAAGKELRQQTGGKKEPAQKLAKMKHQITHLASMAVARDDELKAQWAASRESKAASKRKYGF
uniref:Mitotic checkpoint regulator, MAD2B-interacting-domain-containing protein n=1 Tax=Panagrolaimus superbus TaxID=310955 RepID=A0A914YE35_9BILA